MSSLSRRAQPGGLLSRCQFGGQSYSEWLQGCIGVCLGSSHQESGETHVAILLGPQRRTDNKQQINAVLFCPTNENYILAGGKDKEIRLCDFWNSINRSYDARTYNCLQTFKGHNYDVTAAAFCPTDGTLFVTGDYQGTLNYWSL